MAALHTASHDAVGNQPFLAFVSKPEDIATLRAFAAAKQWGDACILEGDIRTATEYLQAHPSPQVLFIELPSAQEAPALLDALADYCAPDTKVIATGSVNEYSFYCWLTEVGIFSYLLQPLNENSLQSAWERASSSASDSAAPKEVGKIVGIMGARGGVGASAISVMLASLLARHGSKEVSLIDLDPQDGSISLLLELEPTHGMREALEKPDRIDTLFLDRLMVKAGENLRILSTEDTLGEPVHYHEHAAHVLLTTLKEKFGFSVIDLPRNFNNFTRSCLRRCDQILLVCEPNLQCLREAMRIHDFFRDSLHIQPPQCILNRSAMAAKFEISKADFEKSLKAEVSFTLPFAPDIFMKIGADIPALKQMNAPAMKTLLALAASIDPTMALPSSTKEKKPKGFLKKG